MTDPSRPIPEGAYRYDNAGELQGITEESVKQIARNKAVSPFKGVDTWQGGLVGIGGKVGNVLANIVSSVWGVIPGAQPAEDLINQLFGLKLNTAQALNDAASAIQQVGEAVDTAVNSAITAVVNGMNDIGQWANQIRNAMSTLINAVLGSIFGDGGTKWGQEVLAASGPVTTGFNDIPLGFGMPFSGKITDLTFVSSDHLSTGSGTKITIDVRKNGSVIYTANWNGGNNSLQITGLSIDVAKYDRITFNVTTATSQAANMSVSVTGKYV